MVDVVLTLEADADGLVGGIRVSRKELEDLKRSVDGAANSSRRAGKDADDLGRKFDGLGKKTKGANKELRTMRRVITAVGFVALTSQAISAGNSLQGVENSLVATTGSLESARQEMSFVTFEANRLGLEVVTLQSQYAKLTAASKGTRLEGALTRDLFSATAEAARTLNLTAANTGGVLDAFSQILSKGKVQAEELRGQLGDRLPGALRLMAEALGVSQQEISDLLDDGALLAEEVLPLFALRMRDGAKAGLELAKNSPAAEITKARNALTLFSAEFARNDLLPALATGAKFAAENITSIIVALSGLVGLIAGKAIASFASMSVEAIKMARALIVARGAVGGLSKALSVLGGPVGIIFAVVTTLATYGATLDDTAERTQKVAERTAELTAIYSVFDARRIAEQTVEVERLEDALESALGQLKANVDFRDRGEGTDGLVAQASARVKELEQQLSGAEVKLKQFEGAAEANSAELEKWRGQLGKVGGTLLRTESSTDKASAAIDDLDQIITQATRTFDPLLAAQREYVADIEKIIELSQVQNGTLADQIIAYAKVLKAISVVTTAFEKNKKALEDANSETKEYTDLLEDIASSRVDGSAEAILRLELAIESATTKLGEQSEVVQQLRQFWGLLREEQSHAGVGITNATSNVRDSILGIADDLVSALARGEDGFVALGRAANQAVSLIKDLPTEQLEKFGKFGAGLSGLSAGLNAGANTTSKGGAALQGALSGALSGAQFGLPGAIIGGIVGAVSGFFSAKDDPRIDVVNNLVNPENQFTRLSPLGVTVQGQRITEGTPGAEIIAAVQKFDTTLASIPGLLDRFGPSIRDALLQGHNLFEGQFTTEQILEDRFNDILSGLPPIFSSVIDSVAFSLEQRVAALDAAIQISGQVDRSEDLFRGELAIESVFESILALANPGEELAQIYERLSAATDSYRTILLLTGQQVDGLAQEIVGVASEVTDALGGVQRAQGLFGRVFSTIFDEAELLQARLVDARTRATRELGEAGLGADTTRDQLRDALTTALESGASPEVIAGLIEAGAALADVIDLEQALANARGEGADAAESALRAQESLSELMRGIGDRIDEFNLSEFQIAMRDLRRDFDEVRQEAQSLGASHQELARIEQAFALESARLVSQLKEGLRELTTEFLGRSVDDLDDRIAELQSQVSTGFQSVDSQIDRTFEQWERGLERVRGFLDDLLLDRNLTTLTPRERLDEARSQFESTLAAARGGDVGALQRLPNIAKSFLGEARDFFASSGPFSSIFDEVTTALQDLPAAQEQPDRPTAITFSSAASAELQTLLAQRAERDKAAEDERRRTLATDIVTGLRDLAEATGESVIELAAELGVELRDITSALGIDLARLTADTTIELSRLSNRLGIDLVDFAGAVGVSLGSLADAQSLLNDALEGTIHALPTDFRDLLSPLLRDIETATTQADARAAITALEAATRSLPPQYANQLAPFLDGIDITTEAEAQVAELSRLNITQGQALDTLGRIATAVGAGPSLPIIGPAPSANQSIGLVEVQQQILRAVNRPQGPQQQSNPDIEAILREILSSNNRTNELLNQLALASDRQRVFT